MVAFSFMEAFVEIFNVTAAVGIIFFCGLILFKLHRTEKNMLKARLFLNDTILHQTWSYISIAGISFALNALIKLLESVTAVVYLAKDYYIVQLIQFICLMAFIFALHSWYLFMNGHHPSKVI